MATKKGKKKASVKSAKKSGGVKKDSSKKTAAGKQSRPKALPAVKAGKRAGAMKKAPSAKGRTIKFEIDGKTIVGREGQTIVEAARDNGIYIPVLCWYKGLKPAGICRICTVKVGGRNMAACTTPIAEGMIVENNIPELEDMRKAIVEMLFVEGNHMCPTCEKSGNCELQALGYRYQLLAPRFPYMFPQRDIVAYRHIMIDTNRCVQCRRCVRGIVTNEGKHIFSMQERSGKSVITADPELEAKMSEQLAKRAMDQCPVGAILKKEVGFAVPIGKRRFDRAPIGSDVEN